VIPSEWRRERDLRAAALLALVCVLLAVVAPPAWLRTGPMLLLVLVLPGYALCAALLPSRSIPALDRSLLVLALSISATALGALVVQVAFDLGRFSWALLLAAVTWGACAWAARRRVASRSDGAGGAAAASARRAPDAQAPRAPVAVGALGALALIASAAIAVAAIAVAVDGADEQGTVQFAELSAVQPEVAGLPADQVDLAVQNDESASRDYVLRLRREKQGAPREWAVALDPGARWEQSVPLSAIPGEGRVRVALYRDGALYRRVDVESGG
jgi:uncharacterized membrane protein